MKVFFTCIDFYILGHFSLDCFLVKNFTLDKTRLTLFVSTITSIVGTCNFYDFIPDFIFQFLKLKLKLFFSYFEIRIPMHEGLASLCDKDDLKTNGQIHMSSSESWNPINSSGSGSRNPINSSGSGSSNPTNSSISDPRIKQENEIIYIKSESPETNLPAPNLPAPYLPESFADKGFSRIMTQSGLYDYTVDQALAMGTRGYQVGGQNQPYARYLANALEDFKRTSGSLQAPELDNNAANFFNQFLADKFPGKNWNRSYKCSNEILRALRRCN